MLSWIRSPPRRIWRIPSPAPTFAASCTKVRTPGRCWPPRPAKTPPPSKIFSRLEFCGWIGPATRAERRAIEGLRFFVPQGTSRRLRERLLALSASTRAEIYEMREPDAAMQKIDPADAGNLESWLVPRDQIESALQAASGTIAHIRAMLPRKRRRHSMPRACRRERSRALHFTACNSRAGRNKEFFSGWEIPRSCSRPRTNARSSVCCTSSICIAAR